MASTSPRPEDERGQLSLELEWGGPRAEPAAPQPPAPREPLQWPTADPDDPRSLMAANLAALRVVRAIAVERRQDPERAPTEEERAVLRDSPGLGAVPEVFDESRRDWAEARAELKALLGRRAYAAARTTVKNAYATDRAHAELIWQAMERLGFEDGRGFEDRRVLEPSVGSGTFLELAPPNAQMTGVEVEPATAMLARLLHPQAEIRTESFSETPFEDGHFDAVVGSVPIANTRLHDLKHNRGRYPMHDHFVLKSLALARPGGLVALVTSHATLDNLNAAARTEMAFLADLVGAVRMPADAGGRAGPDVVTDLLIFRRREAGVAPASLDWVASRPQTIDGQQVAINDYFTRRGKQQILGRLAVDADAHPSRMLRVEADPSQTTAELTAALERIAPVREQTREQAPTITAEAQPDELVRNPGPAPLEQARPETLRGDPGPGELLHGAGGASGAGDPGAGGPTGGAGPAAGGVPAEGGSSEHGAAAGGGSGVAGAGADSGTGGLTPPADTPAPPPAQASQPVVTPPAPVEMPSDARAQVAANLAALRTLKQLDAERRPPTEQEREVLAQWTAWGGLSAPFDEQRAEWAAERAELLGLLELDGYEAARQSAATEHHVERVHAEQIWKALERLGFEGDRVLEPIVTTTAFVEHAPAGVQVGGTECDRTTAAIMKILHPRAATNTEPFVKTYLPENRFDAVVGSVPFALVRLHDPTHNPRRHLVHEHYIIKSLRVTRPGGLVALITTRGTLDNPDTHAREDMHDLAELVGAVRMPNSAHRETPGTDVVTDLLIFRRREPGADVEPANWIHTVTRRIDGRSMTVNAYFATHHGDHAMGPLTAKVDPDGQRRLRVALDPARGTFADQFEALLEQIARSQERAPELEPAPQPDRPAPEPDRPEPPTPPPPPVQPPQPLPPVETPATAGATAPAPTSPPRIDELPATTGATAGDANDGLVQEIWNGLTRHGLGRGKVLGLGAGLIGDAMFLEFAPRGAKVISIEADAEVAALARAREPKASARIRNESFAALRYPRGHFVAAVGYVPFADGMLYDREHNPDGHSAHNHFILKALALTAPGGMIALLATSAVLDASSAAVRGDMQDLADLVGAVRLPSIDGTDHATDLLLFRRREDGAAAARADWLAVHSQTVDGQEVSINGYFAKRLGHVLGRLAADPAAKPGERVRVHADPARGTTSAQVARLLERLVPGREAEPSARPAAAPARPAEPPAKPAEPLPRPAEPPTKAAEPPEPAARQEQAAEPAEEPAEPPPPPTQPPEPAAPAPVEAPSDPRARVAGNLAAMRTLKQLDAEGRPATEQDREALAKWTAWGGLHDLFDENRSEWV
ncbi:MAG TPA: class I SAM-dependent methyltransferase, partial [Conexibacter sp.]|nr:class I SAM-dependent methyltransferase [Conexibacter sp.]